MGGSLQGDAELAEVRVCLHAMGDDHDHDVVEDEVEDPVVRQMLRVQVSADVAEMGRGECAWGSKCGEGGWRGSAGGGGRRVGVSAGARVS